MPVYESFSLKAGLETHESSEIVIQITKVHRLQKGIRKVTAVILNVDRSSWARAQGLREGVRVTLQGTDRMMELTAVDPQFLPLNGHGDHIPYAQLTQNHGVLVFRP